MVEDGYEFFSKRQLVTLFSAPNYCGEFDNAGAMMSVDESLMCSFQVSKSANMRRTTLVMRIYASQIIKPPEKKAKFWGSSKSTTIDGAKPGDPKTKKK